jgi:hypothetical protein
MEDRYNPQHIDSLPSEVRSSILHRCAEPKALHPFASYFDNSRRVVLHFEHFVCDGDGTFCTSSRCLDPISMKRTDFAATPDPYSVIICVGTILTLQLGRCT